MTYDPSTPLRWDATDEQIADRIDAVELPFDGASEPAVKVARELAAAQVAESRGCGSAKEPRVTTITKAEALVLIDDLAYIHPRADVDRIRAYIAASIAPQEVMTMYHEGLYTACYDLYGDVLALSTPAPASTPPSVTEPRQVLADLIAEMSRFDWGVYDVLGHIARYCGALPAAPTQEGE